MLIDCLGLLKPNRECLVAQGAVGARALLPWGGIDPRLLSYGGEGLAARDALRARSFTTANLVLRTISKKFPT